MDREMLRGSIPLFILSLLAKGPMYGYLIREQLQTLTNGGLDLPDATIYNALKRLQEGGLIKSYWETQPNGRERHYYELLPEGQAHLASQLVDWHAFMGMAITVFDSATQSHP